MPTTTPAPTSATTPVEASIARSRPIATTALLVALATAANCALYGVGVLAGGEFVLHQSDENPRHVVPPYDVVWKSALPVVLGVAVTALIARWTRRGALITTIAFTAVGVASALGPLLKSYDALPGVLLAAMHVTSSAAYLVSSIAVTRRR
ncbi:hypothetical protein GCM10011490_17420 [Pseudoclavibacter endophyticus]|uniref:Uncharacterized protein n=1 Tax=Pseudoclavibacter endophyticus TaxID=1778590 RepID=A0A6H9WJB4_9MICO|nr:DUF6069 family protein [Pseudoclavibacter endophyticus]KAB1648906.1 hypothetical protein F8O04_00950 [Pseudoclavibacter endophyticus]GGA67357.1 hypothetical protein GCM10011490_17420 [Pseudoclavibacter endophyticus]